jgi:hypothetical protein
LPLSRKLLSAVWEGSAALREMMLNDILDRLPAGPERTEMMVIVNERRSYENGAVSALIDRRSFETIPEFMAAVWIAINEVR